MFNKLAYDKLRANQRQLDQDGIEVGVSRQALDQVLDAYAAAATPNGPMLLAIHDALGCFWNGAIGAAHERQDSAAMSLASVCAQGVAAVSERLKEIALEPAPDEAPRPSSLDFAYTRINALGGTIRDGDLHGAGYVQAIDDVLKILLSLGAKDVPYSVLVAEAERSPS